MESTISSSEVFVNQTAAVVHIQPSAEADIIERLDKGKPLTIFPSKEDTGTQWLPVRLHSGQEGFIRANTLSITREELITERAKTQHGYAVGRGKMVMGGGILLVGVVAVVDSLVMPQHAGAFFLRYGVIAAGAGEFFWGFEQVSFVRRALKEFDNLWYRAFPEKYNKPQF